MSTTSEVIGISEMHLLLEVEKRTPHAWQFRSLLPEPDFDSINGSRAWKRGTLIRWAVQTGRLPESLRDEARKVCRGADELAKLDALVSA